MSDSAGCCAHLTVKYKTKPVGKNGAVTGWWECEDCQSRFIPESLRAASPAEDTLAALKAVQDLFTNDSPFYIKKLGSAITNADQERIDHVFIKVGAAIKEAEKRAAEGPKPGPRCPKCHAEALQWADFGGDIFCQECGADYSPRAISDFAQFFSAQGVL